MTIVEVNGQQFTRVKQVDVSNSLDDFSGTARIIVTEPTDDDSVIKIGDKASIIFDNIKVITGYVESISDSETNDSHDVDINIRSAVSDLIDSTIPDNLKFVEGVSTFKDLVQKAIDGLGLKISIVDNVNITFTDDIKSGEVGQKCFDFLQEYARKAQVFLNTDGLGNVYIRRPGGDLTTHLVEGVNILESSISLDYSERYNKYVVYSNSNVTAEGNTDNLNVKGEATDSSIRTTRVFEKIAEKPMSADECANAAIEEANIRRIRSFNYTCKVAGFSGNGELWQEGKLANTYNPKKGVVGKYVIRSINYNMSDAGEFTTMNLTEPDAYKLQAELSASDKQTITEATPYVE